MASDEIPKNLVERLGAALVAPRAAFAASEGKGGQGRSPGDLALLIAIGFCAVHTAALVSAGWLAVTGEIGAAFGLLVATAARDLSTPLLLLFAASVALSIAAGRKRSFGSDFDLVCVVFVPVVAVHLAAALAGRAGVGGGAFDLVTTVVAYGWGAVMLALAWQCARRREVAR